MNRVKKIMFRIMAVSIAVILCVGLAGCRNKKDDKKDYRLNIVTTLFPYYDITRAIVGNVDDIHISMTVAPGQDSHSFEPSPADVIEIDEADLFIYNGGSLEAWVDTLLDSLDNDNQNHMKMMDYVEVLEEEHVEGIDMRFESGEEHEHAEDKEINPEFGGNLGNIEFSTKENEHEDSDEHEADEHIWTSPVNVQILTQKICDRLCELSPENADVFWVNAQNYIDKLQNLDNEFRIITDNADKKEIIFADRFPILYFAKEYGLEYYAAFPGCGSDMEPSVKTIAFLIDKIKKDNLKAVFYLELSSHRVADAISEDTKTETLQFNSCHNITQKQFDDGVTYIDLMEENVDNLRKALNES